MSGNLRITTNKDIDPSTWLAVNAFSALLVNEVVEKGRMSGYGCARYVG
jgi:hypothetical protein